jgi:hypothetical protein
MIDLILEKRDTHPFLKWYEEVLIRSEYFNVRREEHPENTEYLEYHKKLYQDDLWQTKHGSLSFLRIAGKLIVLDLFAFPDHSYQLCKSGLFNDIKPDFWISYDPSPKIERLLGCPAKPWIMFPAGWEAVNKFRWSGNWTYTGIITSGQNSIRRMRRISWVRKAESLGDFYCTRRQIRQSRYLRLLARSKWGLIISHKGLKNTREYEFPSCGIPMAMNYQPIYEYPFYPNEHYVLLNKPNDLEKLRDIDAHYYARQSRWIWDHYLRPDKAAALLLRMID